MRYDYEGDNQYNRQEPLDQAQRDAAKEGINSLIRWVGGGMFVGGAVAGGYDTFFIGVKEVFSRIATSIAQTPINYTPDTLQTIQVIATGALCGAVIGFLGLLLRD